MAMDATVLGQELIAAVDAAIAQIDKDPATNPDMGVEIKEAQWNAVAQAIVAHIQAQADVVDMTGATIGEV